MEIMLAVMVAQGHQEALENMVQMVKEKMAQRLVGVMEVLEDLGAKVVLEGEVELQDMLDMEVYACCSRMPPPCGCL